MLWYKVYSGIDMYLCKSTTGVLNENHRDFFSVYNAIGMWFLQTRTGKNVRIRKDLRRWGNLSAVPQWCDSANRYGWGSSNMPVDYPPKSKKDIRKEIQRILHEKNVDGPIRSRIINSLVNYTYNTSKKNLTEDHKPTYMEEAE
jgi:hypothetical protein